MNVSKIILSLVVMTIFVNCSMNNDAKIAQLPEIINQDTGLRELRFRRYDCLHLTPNEATAACTDNEEIKPEESKPATSTDSKGSTKTPVVPNLTEPNLRVNEITPWLDTRSRTVVNPTVMYNDTKSEVNAFVYLRMFDSATSQFKDYKYEFKADVKTHKENFKRTRQKQYLNFTRTKSESKEVLNAAAYCYDNPTCKDITLVVTFLNFNSKGESFVDSRPFQIDQREPVLKPTDSVPAKATRSVDQPVYEEEPTLEDKKSEDAEETMDAANPELSHTDDAFSQSPIGPVLSTDNIESLCEGLVSPTEACPKYLLDPTLPKPKSASEEEAIRKDYSSPVNLIRTYPEADGDSEKPVEVEPKGSMKSSIRPRPRPEKINQGTSEPVRPSIDTSVPRSTVEPVDVIKEEVFPNEDVILEDVARKPEENVDLLPQTKTYNTSDYYQFFVRMKIQKELAQMDAKNQTTLPAPSEDKVSVESDVESESPLAIKSSLRPKPRPENLGQKKEAEATKVAPLVSVDGKFTYDLSLCGEHAVKAKNIKYYQSRGFYARKGSINKASHYIDSDYETNYLSPGRSSSQYASELTKQVIEFAGCVLEQRYGDRLETHIKDLSYKNGGRLGGHSSHQNGLDADVSYPHLNGKTTSFDNFAGNMTTERTIAALDLARIMIYTDRVHILFTDNRIRKKFCSYLKTNNKLSSYRDIVEKYMYHVGGHHNHYHVRMKCNSQNEGCEAQGKFKSDSYCGK